jgi:hypothetical protein
MLGETLRIAMLDGAATAMAGGVEVRMHTGDPGPAGTAHVLAPGDGYAHLTGVSFARVMQELKSLSAQVLGTRTGGVDVTLTHFSVWKDGSLLFAAEMESPVSYAVHAVPPRIPVGGLTASLV